MQLELTSEWHVRISRRALVYTLNTLSQASPLGATVKGIKFDSVGMYSDRPVASGSSLQC